MIYDKEIYNRIYQIVEACNLYLYRSALVSNNLNRNDDDIRNAAHRLESTIGVFLYCCLSEELSGEIDSEYENNTREEIDNILACYAYDVSMKLSHFLYVACSTYIWHMKWDDENSALRTLRSMRFLAGKI